MMCSWLCQGSHRRDAVAAEEGFAGAGLQVKRGRPIWWNASWLAAA